MERRLKVPSWFRSKTVAPREQPALADQWRLDAPPERRNPPRPAEPRQPPEPRDHQRAPQPRPAPRPAGDERVSARPPQTWRPPAIERPDTSSDFSPPRVPAAPRAAPHPEQRTLQQRILDAAHRANPRPQPASMPLPGEGILAADGLQKTYGARRVVNDVSIDVMRGEAVGLLGPNGAGKTTVFYMVTGLVAADAGRIALDGHDVTGLPMYRRARLGIGYLPQEPSIFRGLNVEDNLRAVLEVVEPDKERRAETLEELLEEFAIEHLRKSPAIALSGGERRRVEIARSLASKPNYMLLDEPFAGIDPIAVGDIRALVRHLTRRGIGVLITDHNVRETLGIIDRAYIVHSGSILMEGSPDEIVDHPDVRRLYLGEEFRL